MRAVDEQQWISRGGLSDHTTTARTGTSDSQDGAKGYNGAYDSVCMALGSLYSYFKWAGHPRGRIREVKINVGSRIGIGLCLVERTTTPTFVYTTNYSYLAWLVIFKVDNFLAHFIIHVLPSLIPDHLWSVGNNNRPEVANSDIKCDPIDLCFKTTCIVVL